jgi:hypothetical protein
MMIVVFDGQFHGIQQYSSLLNQRKKVVRVSSSSKKMLLFDHIKSKRSKPKRKK